MSLLISRLVNAVSWCPDAADQPRRVQRQIEPLLQSSQPLPPALAGLAGWEAAIPSPTRHPTLQPQPDHLVSLSVCPTVSALPASGSNLQESGLTINLGFHAPSPAFILVAIMGELESGTPPLQIASLGGDASGLSWQRLAGGQVGATGFTLEYWGAFAPAPISSDTVTVTFNQSAECQGRSSHSPG